LLAHFLPLPSLPSPPSLSLSSFLKLNNFYIIKKIII